METREKGLKDNDVLLIRQLYISEEYVRQQLADRYSLTQLTAINIINKSPWAHIEENND